MKFELFMCCSGNGITICNKSVYEHGDYKKVAHIKDTGKIEWYVKPSTIPGKELLRIEHIAHVQEEKWDQWFFKMSEIKQYEFLLDRIPLKDFLEIISKKDLSMWEKIQLAKIAYYHNS